MTATVQFLTGSAKNALLVPNAALRFRATPEMMAQVGMGQGTRTAGNSASATGGATTGASTGAANGQRTSGYTGARSGAARSNAGVLWYLDKTGKLTVARVKTGLTDGQTTEIIPRDSTSVQPGLQVITGSTTATASTTSTSSANPLQPQAQRGGQRGPGGF
jgi:HlyD family secretion protein